MYEHGYYAGTHKLMEGGKPVLRHGHPVPDAEANIQAYASRLVELNSSLSPLIHKTLE
jgi:hypothetical protein